MSAHPIHRTGEQCVSIPLNELLQLSSSACRLSLSAFLVKGSRSGQQLSRLFGRGMEFSESRKYQEGDDVRSIDWRVTARTGKVHTKLFAEEKERQILLCADFRSPMFFATKGVFKSVQASLIIGTLAWSAVQGGNRLGGILFDDETHHEFRPASGRRGVLPFLQKLAECAVFKPERRGLREVPSMDNAIEGIKRVAAPGSLVVIVSDFRSFSPRSRDLLNQLASHCDLCLCFVYDPLEAVLPKNGIYPVSDGHREMMLNTFDRNRVNHYQDLFIERKESVASLKRGRHIHFIECTTSDDYFHVLKEHFR